MERHEHDSVEEIIQELEMGSLADGGCKLDMDEELEGAAVSAGWGGTLPVPISPHNQGALHTNLRRLRHDNTIVAAKSHLKSVLKAPDSLAPLPTCGIHCTSMRAHIQQHTSNSFTCLIKLAPG